MVVCPLPHPETPAEQHHTATSPRPVLLPTQLSRSTAHIFGQRAPNLAGPSRCREAKTLQTTRPESGDFHTAHFHHALAEAQRQNQEGFKPLQSTQRSRAHPTAPAQPSQAPETRGAEELHESAQQTCPPQEGGLRGNRQRQLYPPTLQPFQVKLLEVTGASRRASSCRSRKKRGCAFPQDTLDSLPTPVQGKHKLQSLLY